MNIQSINTSTREIKDRVSANQTPCKRYDMAHVFHDSLFWYLFMLYHMGSNMSYTKKNVWALFIAVFDLMSKFISTIIKIQYTVKGDGADFFVDKVRNYIL